MRLQLELCAGPRWGNLQHSTDCLDVFGEVNGKGEMETAKDGKGTEGEGKKG